MDRVSTTWSGGQGRYVLRQVLREDPGKPPCTGQCVFRFGGDVNFFEWSDKIVQLWQGGGGASYVGLQLLASKGRSWIPLSRVNHAYGVRRQDDGSFIEGVLDVNVFYGRVFMFSTPDQVLVGDLPTKYTATSRPASVSR